MMLPLPSFMADATFPFLAIKYAYPGRGKPLCQSKPKLLQPAVHNGCITPQIKKQVFCLVVNSTPTPTTP